jgi:hypothetical protein
MSDAQMEKEVADFADPNGRFAYYAQLHGWFEQLSEANRTFDMKSEENRDRISAYDLRTAAYRMCRILGANPVYVLSDGTRLGDGKNIAQSLYSQIKPEIRQGSFAQWLSVWYHEDPFQDFSEQYSYERTLESWILKLGDIDSQQVYYRRFVNAKDETSKRFDEVRNNYHTAQKKENLWRYVFYVLVAVWILMVAVFGISGREFLLGHSVFTIGIPLGGMTALIVAVRAYFRGYGFLFSSLWGALGLMSSVIPIWVMKFLNHSYPSLFIPAIIIMTLIYVVICHFTDFRSDRKDDREMINSMLSDDIKSELLEPLYYTFKTKSYRYKSSKFGVLDDIQNQVKSVAGESVLHYMLWSALVAVLILEMVVYSPKLMNVGNPDLDNWRLSPARVVKQIQRDVE